MRNYPDISEIGEIDFSWDFDRDDYEEWLGDCEIEGSEGSLDEYIRDNVSFELAFLDGDTFHEFARATMSSDEIEDKYGHRIASEIFRQCKANDGGRFETACVVGDEIDINNPVELNAEAMKLLRHGEYMKDCRGFILSNGTVVYTPLEHNQCTSIFGVKGTYHFIRLGNIRVLQNSVDLARRPTVQQRRVLYKVINSYNGDRLYLDIISDGGTELSAEYVNPNPQYVLGEIDRYFDEGIRPQGRNFYESVMSRKVRLSESQFRRLMALI